MHHYLEDQPTRDEVEALPGRTVLIFGTDWCGYCRTAAHHIDAVLDPRQDLRIIRVEDGKGRPLGRSFKVKLWPTLIFLFDGDEAARVVRPMGRHAVVEALTRLDELAAGDSTADGSESASA